MFTTTQKRSRHSTDTVPKFHAEAPQATASEGFAQGPYVAAKAGFEPTTLGSKGNESTNESPCPTNDIYYTYSDKQIDNPNPTSDLCHIPSSSTLHGQAGAFWPSD